ncbi:ATP-dependent DNA helicase [Fuchsiella alkaliacetigena]|uniref:ATP-dependent DNA helicase n=1 Tax=Fuchsiella alkaliacetigena TaxID=957042 RepID=UPI00200A2B15|nr:helicase C-terminal domain-containing protein [Fuchsiella alkaliacetigena]MCK8823496.1 DEAD/DEAH box helicase family protein [Fuchsiella alkaliacetigena]
MEANEIEKLPVAEISELFTEGSLLAQNLNDYEYRYQQKIMAEVIAKAFNRQTHLLVEAGTGTGKSWAYLVPSIYWALQNKQRVVVSTNTINLQEQLIKKDIPFLQQVLDKDFKAVLVKGRSNYLCLRKLYTLENLATEVLSEAEFSSYSRLLAWNKQAVSGCRSELLFQPQFKLWQRVASESESCLRANCPYQQRCYFTQARQESISADILVVNHHLLFADIAVRKEEGMDLEMAVLPKYKHIILDEAHNIEEVATSYLGKKVSQRELLSFLHNLYPKESKQGIEGFLLELRFRINQAKEDIEKKQRLELQRLIDNTLQPLVLKSTERSNIFFECLANFTQELKTETASGKLRLKENIIEHADWLKVTEEAENFLLALNQLLRELKKLSSNLALISGVDFEDYEGVCLDLEAKIKYLQQMVETVDLILNDSATEEVVNWIETKQNSQGEINCNLNSAPVDIAAEFKERLLVEMDSIIFTSATLTVDQSFSYIRDRLGLTEELVAELRTGDPFDYQQQAMLAVPIDLPGPNSEEFTKQAIAALAKLLFANQGRSLVLFTSYKMLNSFYLELKSELKEAEIDLYRQGDKSRHLLIKDFKESKAAVILGTASFWEGVDIPGDKLSLVVIVKLPFKVPTDPIVEAKVEELESTGKDPFLNYMLPQAVIKFKQGFGRLIRSQTDQGVVVVLDKRIINRRYGQVFINSIPRGCQVLSSKIEIVAEEINKFWDSS